MYHFIGIKGSGMASLACILKDTGECVSGSDIDHFIFTQKSLDERNIPYTTFNKNNIKNNMMVIIGNSFDESNEEVYAAIHNDTVKTYTYPKFLGHLVDTYHSICVSGTHGKTNTTGMLSHVMNDIAPCGYLIGDGTGYMPQDAKTFVLESCEYKRNFLAYHPDYAIVLNVELDHVDYYTGLEDYIDAFNSFCKQVKKGIAVFGDEVNTRKLTITTPHLYYGLQEDNDVYATNVIENEFGVSFDCIYKGEYYASFKLPLFGKHLLWNALGVITIGIMNNISPNVIEASLQNYDGVKRRFSIEEEGNNVYIDDYAHHPTAIALTIEAAKQKYPSKKVIAFFKPDRYSRIEYFLPLFADAFTKADEVYFFDFPNNAVREEGINVTIQDLVNQVENSVLLSEDVESAKQMAAKQPACYLFMSSKDIYKFKDIVKKFQ